MHADVVRIIKEHQGQEHDELCERLQALGGHGCDPYVISFVMGLVTTPGEGAGSKEGRPQSNSTGRYSSSPGAATKTATIRVSPCP